MGTMECSERYRGMDRAALDIAYNNRAVVPGWEQYLGRWQHESDDIYAAATARDVAYGAGARQRLDFFMPQSSAAPVFLFLHGGYWQWNDKEGQAFVARGFLDNGLGAIIGEYSLAPEARMSQMCEEVIAQVRFARSELDRRGHDGPLYVSGISTGAHLTACTLDLPEVAGALLISGLYDLEPIRISSLNAPIAMDWAEARRWSPLHRIGARSAPVIIAHGADERPEIVRQSTDFHAALLAHGHSSVLLPVPGKDHFSVLDTLSNAHGFLAKAAVQLAAGR